MMQNPALLTDKRLREIYPKLCLATKWWLMHRDYDGDGLPEYHHGNDSGWDNNTAFDVGRPEAGAALAAYLVSQMDTLALLAQKLGKKTDAKKWQQKADAMFSLMLEKLAEALKPDGRFITACGPATENSQSPLYLENSYWPDPSGG